MTEKDITIAVIGGSTFDRSFRGDRPFAEGLAENEGNFRVDTAAGKSPTIHRMRYKGVGFYFIPFHGVADFSSKEYNDGRNFVTTLAALYNLGVTHAVGGATGGAVNPSYRVGDVLIADDLMNFNFSRPASVLAEAAISRDAVRSRFNPPFCPDIRGILIELADANYTVGKVHTSATVVQTDSSRYETPAEVRNFGNMGGDFVTHNIGTEAIYARQLGIHFAVLNSVSNPAEGVGGFTLDSEMDTGEKIAEQATPIILETVARLQGHLPQCGDTCRGER
jgi:5'-methylthioadenosine phosphorylase